MPLPSIFFAPFRSCVLVFRRSVSPLVVTLAATGRSTAHTECRNEVKDLERSAELCGRAVADNENERGNNIDASQVRLAPNGWGLGAFDLAIYHTVP